MTAAEQPMTKQVSFPQWLTLERAAYGGIVLFAGVWRAFQLGLYPLGPGEVRQALTAWEAAQGKPVTLWGLSPLLFTLQEATFFFAQSGDALARLWPMLAGLLICLIPYALRRRIGREAALLAAGFLALSPTLTYFARYSSGDVMAAAAALGAFAAALAAREDARWLPWGTVALAFGLISGPGIYTALLAWALAAVLWGRADVTAVWSAGWAEGHARRALLLGGLVFLLGATSWLRHWDGVGAAAGVLGTWAARWARPEAGYPIYWPLLRLALDEPLLVAFGLYGAASGVRRGDGLTKTLSLWAGLAVLWPTLTPGRQPEDLVMAIPPLALLAALGAIAFLRQVDLGDIRWEATLIIVALAALSVTVYVWVSGYSLWGTGEYAASMLAPLGLMVALVIFLGFWADWRAAAQVTILFLSGMGTLWMLSAGWINAHGVDLNRRPAVRFEMTSVEVRMVRSDLERLSEHRVGDAHLLPIEIMDTPQAPVLRWYLREMKDVQIVGAPLRGEAAPVVITPLMEELAPGEKYNGRGFVVTERWEPMELQKRDLVRWLLLRQSTVPAGQQRAILWVKREEQPGE